MVVNLAGDNAYAYTIPVSGDYEFIFNGNFTFTNFLNLANVYIAIWAINPASLPYGFVPITLDYAIQTFNIGGSSNNDFYVQLSKTLNAGDKVFCTYYIDFPPLGFQTIEFNNLEFSYINCKEDVYSNSVNEYPYIVKMEILQTGAEFDALVKTIKRYGYYKWRGCKLYIKEIINNGSMAVCVFNSDKLPDCV